MNVVARSTRNTNGEQRINSEVYIKVLIKPTNSPLGVSPSEWNQKPHEAKKKSFDLGGNQTHDVRIRSTVTLPTELRGRTEKVGDDFRWIDTDRPNYLINLS